MLTQLSTADLDEWYDAIHGDGSAADVEHTGGFPHPDAGFPVALVIALCEAAAHGYWPPNDPKRYVRRARLAPGAAAYLAT